MAFDWAADDIDYGTRYLMGLPPELREAPRRLAGEASRIADIA